MRQILVILTMLCLAVGAQAEATGRKWAVVIGIDRYQNPGVTPLKYAEADARTLADALVKYGGFQPNDVFVLTTDKTGYEFPTRTNVAFRFDYLIKSMGPNDTLVVYFSGHGVEIEGQSFLLTAEADSRSLLTLQQSALEAKDLFAWLSATKAARTLLVVDACRNDPMAGRGDANNALSDTMAKDLTLVARQDQAPGREVIPASATFFACSAGQRSYEWSDKGHGFFTYYLVQGLQGQAAGTDGRVTLQSLTSYVQREVADASSRWLMQKQVPWLRYEGPGADSWEFARGQTRPSADNKDTEMAARLAEAEARAAREEAARKEAEQRAAKAEAARKDAEAKAKAADAARREAEEKARKADQAAQAAHANPNDPVLAEKARQSDAERRAAESKARQAEDEHARSSEAAELLNQLLGMKAQISGTSSQLPLFVSHGANAPYATLAAALRDATANSTIMVTAGTFQEDLVFTRPVTIEGDRTILQGTLRADTKVRIENCTIRGQLIPLSNFELVRCNLELKP